MIKAESWNLLPRFYQIELPNDPPSGWPLINLSSGYSEIIKKNIGIFLIFYNG